MAHDTTKSLDFMHYLYEETGDEYIGALGPYDAFSPHYEWKTERYLAIDQGTIGPMLENYKTQLFWNLFMNAPEIKQGLQNLGFTSSEYDLGVAEDIAHNSIQIFPNPALDMLNIISNNESIGSKFRVIDNLGRMVLFGSIAQENTIVDINSLSKGVYYIMIENQSVKQKIMKM